MDKESDEELRALVIGFLQQSLKENPRGFSLRDFERLFPQRCDEPDDWYKRYNKKSCLDALISIREPVKVDQHSQCVSLDLRSSKVDRHIVDLVQNQKSSNKKGSFRRPSSRALSSFSLNRQYSSYYGSNHRSRLNHGQNYRDESQHKRFTPLPTTQSGVRRSIPSDPRIRSATLTPPQVRPQPSYSRPVSTYVTPSSPASNQLPTRTQVSTPTSDPKPLSSPPSLKIQRPASSKPEVEIRASSPEDPVLLQKKIYLRQRIVSLLTRKFSEIKLIHLNSLYKLEYEESIDPTAYGHKNLTTLMADPLLKNYIQVNYKSPFVTISARKKLSINGKENIASSENNHRPVDPNALITSDQVNNVSSTKAKLNAIDPFNVKSMLQSLEPLGSIKGPPLKNMDIDEGVKYKTLRIIFKSHNSTIRLDDWQIKFEQESRLKIRIRDYGFKTLLEFFKHLALELPIKIHLNKQDEWIAVADMFELSSWINEKLSKGFHRAIIALDSINESIAYPNDTYTFYGSTKLVSKEFHPVYISPVKRASSLWLQLRQPKMIEAHLCIEASMTGYQDYRERNLLQVNRYFIKPGFPCAVFDEIQQRWCRALILKAPEMSDRNAEITVLLVDYGITRNCAISQILCLLKAHLKAPVGLIYCRLSGVKDDERNSLSSNTQAKIILQEYTSPPVTLACRFDRAIPSDNNPNYLPETCFEVSLVDTRHGKDCSLNDGINNSREYRPHNSTGDDNLLSSCL